MAEKSGDDEMAKELGNEVGEQLVKKLDGGVVEEEEAVVTTVKGALGGCCT